MAKVLLVEDDNNLREIYEARLQAEGYEISSAQDGEQALVVAKDFKPDLIISDVMMPKISGFEMLDILRNTEGLQNTRVIMLTALGQAEDKQRADSLGADRYLVKSQVTLEDIIKAAHDILDGESSTPATETTAAPADSSATPAEAAPAGPTVDAGLTVASAPEVTPAPEAPEVSASAAVPEPSSGTETPAAETTTVEEATPPTETPTTPVTITPDTPGEATTPSADSTDTATDNSTPSDEPADNAAADTATATTSTDDQLLAEAASSLGGAPASDETTDAAPETDPVTAPEEAIAPATEEGDPTGSSKKVIHPIDSEPKPSLADLLAAEEGKDDSATPAPTPAPVVDAVQAMETAPPPPPAGGVIAPTTAPESTEPEAQPTQQKKNDDFNPHDISL
jgi:CheY-like chemotaxis protein